MKSTIIGLCAALSLAACGTSTPMSKPNATPPIKTSALSSNSWSLVSAHDANHKPINDLQATIKGTEALVLNFDQSLSLLSVANACNVMSAATTLQNDILRISKMTTTLMACDPKLMGRDRAVGEYLQGDVQVSLDSEQTLTLKTAQGAQLSFKGTPTPEALYGQSTRLFLEVAAQTKPCTGVAPMTCLYVRPIEFNEQGIQIHVGEWANFYDSIEGYTHKAGTSSVLRVNRYERPLPIPADASSYMYQLDLIVSQSIK
jgi:heat shock protein HslJ